MFGLNQISFTGGCHLPSSAAYSAAMIAWIGVS
jgi:hypothetical protein